MSHSLPIWPHLVLFTVDLDGCLAVWNITRRKQAPPTGVELSVLIGGGASESAGGSHNYSGGYSNGHGSNGSSNSISGNNSGSGSSNSSSSGSTGRSGGGGGGGGGTELMCVCVNPLNDSVIVGANDGALHIVDFLRCGISRWRHHIANVIANILIYNESSLFAQIQKPVFSSRSSDKPAMVFPTH
jgi:hypothetical protein